MEDGGGFRIVEEYSFPRDTRSYWRVKGFKIGQPIKCAGASVIVDMQVSVSLRGDTTSDWLSRGSRGPLISGRLDTFVFH